MGRIDMSDDAKDVFCFIEQLQKLIVGGNFVATVFPSQSHGAFWRMGGGGRNKS